MGELVEAANNKPTEKNIFPIYTTLDAFEYQVSKRGRLGGIDPDAAAIIQTLQPYQVGQDWHKSILWILDELTNINKHHRILLTNLSLREGHWEVTEVDGKLWTHGTITRFDGNTKFGPFPISPGQVQMNTQLFASVTFDEGAAKGEEITTFLNTSLWYVMEEIVPRFERFFYQSITTAGV